MKRMLILQLIKICYNFYLPNQLAILNDDEPCFFHLDEKKYNSTVKIFLHTTQQSSQSNCDHHTVFFYNGNCLTSACVRFFVYNQIFYFFIKNKINTYYGNLLYNSYIAQKYTKKVYNNCIYGGFVESVMSDEKNSFLFIYRTYEYTCV